MEIQREVVQEIDGFLAEWKATGQTGTKLFETIYHNLLANLDCELEFIKRPGISFSLRPRKKGQGRELFAIIDVIDDAPEARWLSVCFYEDMITDPESLGQTVPQGLAGDNGYCFDLFDETILDYVMERIREAYSHPGE